MYTGNWCELSDTQKDENGNYYINTFLYILVFYTDVPRIISNLHAFLPYILMSIVLLYLTTTKIKNNIHEYIY